MVVETSKQGGKTIADDQLGKRGTSQAEATTKEPDHAPGRLARLLRIASHEGVPARPAGAPASRTTSKVVAAPGSGTERDRQRLRETGGLSVLLASGGMRLPAGWRRTPRHPRWKNRERRTENARGRAEGND